MKSFYYIIIFALLGCAFPDNPHKSVNLFQIRKGNNECDQRKFDPILNDRRLTFNFNFQEISLPIDSALQKLYGLSDGFSNHLKQSARLAFRVRLDSTIDIFAYWHIDGNFKSHWLSNIKKYEWVNASISIHSDCYSFRLNDVFYIVNSRHRFNWGIKYRLFPYYEDGDGKGSTGRIIILIEEK